MWIQCVIEFSEVDIKNYIPEPVIGRVTKELDKQTSARCFNAK